jgi:D-arabinose 1-dehydrogenase-like Zn-dependent alcohol dehydrogenase
MAAGIPSMLPIIPGHDGVGTVEEAGEGVAASCRPTG